MIGWFSRLMPGIVTINGYLAALCRRAVSAPEKSPPPFPDIPGDIQNFNEVPPII
jgi:hypothetical protein